MDEEQKQSLDKILQDFNDIGTKAMMELSNGSGQFTIQRGAWTVSLDVEAYINHLNESRERVAKLSGIVDEVSRKWRERLEKTRKVEVEEEKEEEEEEHD